MRAATLAFLGVVALIGGINGLLHPDPTPGFSFPPQQVFFVLMIAGGIILVAVLAISAIRERRELRRIRGDVHRPD